MELKNKYCQFRKKKKKRKEEGMKKIKNKNMIKR